MSISQKNSYSMRNHCKCLNNFSLEHLQKYYLQYLYLKCLNFSCTLFNDCCIFITIKDLILNHSNFLSVYWQLLGKRLLNSKCKLNFLVGYINEIFIMNNRHNKILYVWEPVVNVLTIMWKIFPPLINAIKNNLSVGVTR